MWKTLCLPCYRVLWYVAQSAATRHLTQDRTGVAGTHSSLKSLQADQSMTPSSNHPRPVGLARTAVAFYPFLKPAVTVISVSARCSSASLDLAANQDRAASTASKAFSQSDLLHLIALRNTFES